MLRKPANLSELMRTANRGDASAYRALLEALASWLRSVIRRRLESMNRGPEDVEDIVQETLLAVHLKRHTWAENQPLEPWVRAIAHHKLIDALRRRGFRDHIDIDDLSEELSVQPDMQETASNDFQKLLARLSDRQRKIIEAVAIQGLTAREAANQLGSTEGAVRVALHRALKSLAKAYQRDDP